ncbi:hypothetical protein CEXT_322711 [Caerostris extrusa]|uniref:Secreted protein n=1 Tax=Caerostris extrusa TaxID=172846 RepID=A0AAV4VV28_CAEEX|nr:hypothetical protein CEXT_322711 [Caerostris extrusa]
MVCFKRLFHVESLALIIVCFTPREYPTPFSIYLFPIMSPPPPLLARSCVRVGYSSQVSSCDSRHVAKQQVSQLPWRRIEREDSLKKKNSNSPPI